VTKFPRPLRSASPVSGGLCVGLAGSTHCRGCSGEAVVRPASWDWLGVLAPQKRCGPIRSSRPLVLGLFDGEIGKRTPAQASSARPAVFSFRLAQMNCHAAQHRGIATFHARERTRSFARRQALPVVTTGAKICAKRGALELADPLWSKLFLFLRSRSQPVFPLPSTSKLGRRLFSRWAGILVRSCRPLAACPMGKRAITGQRNNANHQKLEVKPG